MEVFAKLFSAGFTCPKQETITVGHLMYKSSFLILLGNPKSKELEKEESVIVQRREIIPEKMVGCAHFCDYHDCCDDRQGRIHAAMRLQCERKITKKSRSSTGQLILSDKKG